MARRTTPAPGWVSTWKRPPAISTRSCMATRPKWPSRTRARAGLGLEADAVVADLEVDPVGGAVQLLPEAAGLGVHITLDLGGQARFGPDTEWVDHESYDVDVRRADGFYAAIRRYWPGLRDGALAPGYAGIRPKISGPGEPPADFVVAGPAEHGIGGLVNLFGIESPGLTAALAIGEHVAGLVNGRNHGAG